jgi:hypothetical protein
VDACTVAAPDAITAFAVPNGSGCPAGYPVELITQSTLEWLIYLNQSLQSSIGRKVG